MNMDQSNIKWPEKTKELQNHHMDSTRWDNFKFRDDDIVVSTWAKSGTTWMQQILGQLIFDGAEGLPVSDLSPWVEMRVLPINEVTEIQEAQQHRRFMKTHLPLNALVFSPKAKYIFIGRDARDTLWSLYHHHCSYTEGFYQWLNETPGLVGPKFSYPGNDIKDYFYEWLNNDGYPYWEYWSHTQDWWDAGKLPNVLLVHFNNLKKDLSGEMSRIAEFLDIEVDQSHWPMMVEHCTFDYMKKNSEALSTLLDSVFKGGGTTFINKGTNGRWRDMLTAEDLENFQKVVSQKLSPECAHWLETGK